MNQKSSAACNQGRPIVSAPRATLFKRSRLTMAVVLAFCFVFVATARSQDHSPILIKARPNGRPVLLHDDGYWYDAVSVYSDANVELFVSDRWLSPSGVYWDGPGFKKNGQYSAYLYSWYKNDHDCRLWRIPKEHKTDPRWLEACAELRYIRRAIVVDTRKRTINVLNVIHMEADGVAYPNLFYPRNDVFQMDSK